MEQDPSDPSVIYVGTKGSGLFFSLDSGALWQRPEDPDVSSGNILDVEVDPSAICTHYVLKSRRLLKTATCGRVYDNETYVETRTNKNLTALAIDWYNPKTLYLATSDGDILRTVDGGDNWAAIYRANDLITDIAVSNSDSRILLVATRRQGILRSTDSGATWVSLEDDLKQYSKSDNVFEITQTKDGSLVLISSEYGLLTSEDAGATWKSIPLVTDVAEVDVRAIAVAPEDKNQLYYATATTFYTSSSGGNAWATANLPTTRAASILHVDEGDENRLYLGVITLEE
jgi:photosystem II stability/assembly factor-like uncharacterized protein